MIILDFRTIGFVVGLQFYFCYFGSFILFTNVPSFRFNHDIPRTNDIDKTYPPSKAHKKRKQNKQGKNILLVLDLNLLKCPSAKGPKILALFCLGPRPTTTGKQEKLGTKEGEERELEFQMEL